MSCMLRGMALGGMGRGGTVGIVGMGREIGVRGDCWRNGGISMRRLIGAIRNCIKSMWRIGVRMAMPPMPTSMEPTAKGSVSYSDHPSAPNLVIGPRNQNKRIWAGLKSSSIVNWYSWKSPRVSLLPLWSGLDGSLRN